VHSSQNSRIMPDGDPSQFGIGVRIGLDWLGFVGKTPFTVIRLNCLPISHHSRSSWLVSWVGGERQATSSNRLQHGEARADYNGPESRRSTRLPPA